MDHYVRKATFEDLPVILEIYTSARKFMRENGNPNQWGDNHPQKELLIQDIEAEQLHVVCCDDRFFGVFYFVIGNDPTYENIFQGSWRSATPYGTIHRIASDGSGGVLKAAVEYGSAQIDHLRIDTHHDNWVMQRAVQRLGFEKRGIIYLPDGSPRIAYDRLLNT